MDNLLECYEVINPSFNDMYLSEQIEHKINDWVAIDKNGRNFYGQSREQAIAALNNYHNN